MRAAGTELWRTRLEEKSRETFEANFEMEDSKGGTRGQLVGGTVEGQVVDFGKRSMCPRCPRFFVPISH